MNTIWKIKILVLFLFISSLLNAQFLSKEYYLVDSISNNLEKSDKEMLDALMKRYRAAKQDTTQINVLSEIVESLQSENVWIKYNRLVLKKCNEALSQKNENSILYRKKRALAINNIGYYYGNYTSEYKLTAFYYKAALDSNIALKNYKEIIVGYSNLSGSYQARGDLANAIKLLEKALSYQDKVSNKEILLAPINNLSKLYLVVGDTAKSIEGLKQALSISIKSKDKALLAHLYHNYGIVLYYKKGIGAESYIEKGLVIRKEINDVKGIVISLIGMCDFAIFKKQLTKAENYLNEAENYLPRLKNTTTEGLYYLKKGMLYDLFHKTDLAIINYEKAKDIYKKVFEIEELENCLNNLIKNYSSNKKKYASQLLDAYEMYYAVQERLKLNEVKRIVAKEKYEEELKIAEAQYKLDKQISNAKAVAKEQKQKNFLLLLLVIAISILIFAILIFKSNLSNKKKNKIISKQKEEVETQKQIIEEKHKDITDSITYAHRIQTALIPDYNALFKTFSKCGLIYLPRNIVSGDFYWFTQSNSFFVFALADCTGHGVPGAFMSLIGINGLNAITKEKGIYTPGLVLDELKMIVVNSVNDENNENKSRDGMDIAVIKIEKNLLTFSGANQSIYILRNTELIELKGNKQPVGLSDSTEKFKNLRFELLAKDRIILFSDGIVDQFGSENNASVPKKLKVKRLREWIIETSIYSVTEQTQTIKQKLIAFKGVNEQTDDITFVIFEFE
ncbi:MAG: SpoIIE family protein phosphatase [Bacteroidetes bacterium]|nr:SpoIIE family protein phosphatase [Bacteroidota bacterium]